MSRYALPAPIGAVFHRLTVVADAPKNKHGQTQWVCECVCGNHGVFTMSAVKHGYTKSCGCLVKDTSIRTGPSRRGGAGPFKHGHSAKGVRSPTYFSWQNMKTRCTNTNVKQSKRNYIDRGISYDPSWESFECFLSDMGERLPGTSLDRINNDGNYCKDNCRWADNHTQRMNQRPRGNICQTHSM